ncbi:MAG: ParA family protein [Acidobacteriia bacterium]|nr:ParA family protein [Terriglobia bacterium]
MIRLVIANQRGGVGKTTAAVNYAWYLANVRELRTLLIDTDSQGSVGVMLNLRPKHYFSHLLVNKFPLEECVIPAGTNLHVLCGNKDTVQAESALAGAVVRELALKLMLEPGERNYDAVVIDVSPSINLLQTCAMVYARNVVIPVNMDLLSLNGANAACDMIRLLNDLIKAEIRPVGLLPCQVDQRLSVTTLVQQGVEKMAEMFHIPVLPAIRTDQAVNKAFRARKALLEFDPGAKAAQDYTAAFEKITAAIESAPNHRNREQANAKAETTV